jgi:uncharacterized membrane protein
VLDQNIEAIRSWQAAALLKRTPLEKLSDFITRLAAGGPTMVVHLVWFGGWILVNTGAVGGIEPFDPFPFPFLTMTVSLEAIFLALFVLAAQNRMVRQSDARADLDLQIDMLVEREMTAVLRLLQDIARELDVKVSVTKAQIAELADDADIERLTDEVDTMPEQPGDERQVRPRSYKSRDGRDRRDRDIPS